MNRLWTEDIQSKIIRSCVILPGSKLVKNFIHARETPLFLSFSGNSKKDSFAKVENFGKTQPPRVEIVVHDEKHLKHARQEISDRSDRLSVNLQSTSVVFVLQHCLLVLH